MHSLLVEAILEDLFSDLVVKFPEQKDKLTLAKARGVKPKYFQWLAKILQTTKEPAEDIIPLLVKFDENIPKLKAKFGGAATDITAYKTVNDLSYKLEDLNKSTNNTKPGGDVLYDDNEWTVVFPRSTAESCQSGSGTTWCTARTQSQNLFLSYVGRKENIVLYYLIRKNGNPRSNPTDKISVGFMGGQPVFQNEHGGLTVDSANNGISEGALVQILGADRWKTILEKLKAHNGSLKGIHPAKVEVTALAGNLKAVEQKLATFKDEDSKKDFISILLENEALSQDVLVYLMDLISREPDRELFSEGIGGLLENNDHLPAEIINQIATLFGEYEYTDGFVNQQNISDQTLASLFTKAMNEDDLVKLADHPNVGPLTLKEMLKASLTTWRMEQTLAKPIYRNPHLPPDVFAGAIKYAQRSSIPGLVNNPQMTPELAQELYKRSDAKGFFILGKYVPDSIKIDAIDEYQLFPWEVMGYSNKEVDEIFSDNILMHLTKDKDTSISDWAEGELSRRNYERKQNLKEHKHSFFMSL